MATDLRTPGKQLVEEYRYDALGRRVWVSTRWRCAPSTDFACIANAVTRTIWHGASEVAEIRARYDTSAAAMEEMDAGADTVPQSIVGDANPFYGRVVYGPALALDQPLSVTRFEYRDNPYAQTSQTWTHVHVGAILGLSGHAGVRALRRRRVCQAVRGRRQQLSGIARDRHDRSLCVPDVAVCRQRVSAGSRAGADVQLAGQPAAEETGCEWTDVCAEPDVRSGDGAVHAGRSDRARGWAERVWIRERRSSQFCGSVWTITMLRPSKENA